MYNKPHPRLGLRLALWSHGYGLRDWTSLIYTWSRTLALTNP